MRSSTYVEDIDQKSFHLCGKCREELNKALGELES
jgi:predicted Zn-dependent protease